LPCHGGYHRVNKIGDACQSEPMRIPNISWKVGFPPTSSYLLYSACYELSLPLGLARKGKCPEMIGRMRALSFVILLQYVLHFCLLSNSLSLGGGGGGRGALGEHVGNLLGTHCELEGNKEKKEKNSPSLR